MKYYFLSSLILSIVFISCRVEENPAKRKPSADSFSPGLVKTGDTVSIMGTSICDAKVFVDGKEVELFDKHYYSVSFIVTEEMSANKPNVNLSVELSEREVTTFPQQLIVNYVVEDEDLQDGNWLYPLRAVLAKDDTLGNGPKQLLITDFDGHGVRMANATSRFDQTQFSALVKTGGTQFITSSFLNAPSSQAGNNFLATYLKPEFIEKGSAGFCGELISSTDFMNDVSTKWPSGFLNILGSPLDIPVSNLDLRKYYLNFFVFKNGKEKGNVRPYLSNDQKLEKDSYAYNLRETLGNNAWELVSIPVNNLKTGYGWGLSLSAPEFVNMNKIKFNFNHLDLADDNGANPDLTAEGDCLIYLDHIIITQGGPFVYKKFD